MYARGIPVVGCMITIDENEYQLSIGSKITGLVVSQGFRDPATYTGTVAAIHLQPVVVPENPDRTIYDGVATHGYENPVCAYIDNAADVFSVDRILIELEQEPVDAVEGEEAVTPEPIYVAVDLMQIESIESVAEPDVPAEDEGDADTDAPTDDETTKTV